MPLLCSSSVYESGTNLAAQNSPPLRSVKDLAACGIQVNDSMQSMVARLELLSGRAIAVHCINLPRRKGHAEFSPDGAPTIFLNRDESNNDVFIHEISHLLLQADGYPTFDLSPTRDVEKLLAWPDVAGLLISVQDDISHHVFFANLRSAGFAPDGPWLGELRKLKLDAWRDKDPHYIAEMVFRTRMEIADLNSTIAFERELSRLRFNVSLDLGRRMAESVGDLSHWTKEQILETYIRVTEQFLSGGARVQLVSWRSAAYGRAKLNFADLRVTN